MKRNLKLYLVLVAVLSVSTAAFCQPFEGNINMQITSAKMAQPISLAISTKGDKTAMQMDMPQGSIKVYFDKAAGKMTTVMGKMGMQMDIPKTNDAIKEKSSESGIDIVNSGEKKMINGHSSVRYIATTKDGLKSNWWMTDDLPKSLINSLHEIYKNSGKAAMAARTSAPASAAIAEMFKKGLVPIQVEMLKDGIPETTITMMSFEQKHLPDSEFVIPSDIMIRPMPGMPGMGGE
ncbi:MAG: DUF4412 domain-containing protein [Ignavibacteriota bacterium]